MGGNATEALAGKLTCNTADGTLTAAVKATRIALKGTFEAGKDYYFVVLPRTLPNGFSLLYDDGKGKLYRKATNKNTQLKPGRILNLGTLSLTGFEKAVIKQIYAGLEGGTASDGTVTLSDADLTALAAMTELDLPSGGVTSLGGIGYCTGLTTLKCTNNQLTELNLNGLTQLTVLRCNMNQLTTLDVSQLTNLTELWCFDNKLTELDITRLTNLYRIYCGRQKDGRQLTLTLTAAQKGVWSSWSSDRDNVRVTLDVKP